MCAVGLGWMDKRAEVLVREPLKEREKKKTKGKKKEEQVKFNMSLIKTTLQVFQCINYELGL